MWKWVLLALKWAVYVFYASDAVEKDNEAAIGVLYALAYLNGITLALYYSVDVLQMKHCLNPLYCVEVSTVAFELALLICVFDAFGVVVLALMVASVGWLWWMRTHGEMERQWRIYSIPRESNIDSYVPLADTDNI